MASKIYSNVPEDKTGSSATNNTNKLEREIELIKTKPSIA
jgi:hypothetical protein